MNQSSDYEEVGNRLRRNIKRFDQLDDSDFREVVSEYILEYVRILREGDELQNWVEDNYNSMGYSETKGLQRKIENITDVKKI